MGVEERRREMEFVSSVVSLLVRLFSMLFLSVPSPQVLCSALDVQREVTVLSADALSSVTLEVGWGPASALHGG